VACHRTRTRREARHDRPPRPQDPVVAVAHRGREWKVSNSPAYDKQLAIAVQRFQQRNGLEAKGLLGKQAIIALDIPPCERAKQIMLNMERCRWMPVSLGDNHILANIAAFELQRVHLSVIVERMNVVTGACGNPDAGIFR